MIYRWKEQLEEHLDEWGVPKAPEWTFLVYNNYQPNYSGVDVFWFHAGSQYPLVVEKVYPEPALPQQEFRNLQDAYSCARDVVPTPYALERQDDCWLLWMAAVAGSRLTAKQISVTALDRLCDALVAIQRGVAKERPATAQRCRNVVCAPLEFAAQHCPEIAETCRSMLDRYTASLDRTPSLPQHSDLYSGNIIVGRDGTWRIVDWELLGLIDLPFYDVVRFLFSIGGDTSPDRWPEAIQGHARHLIARYSEALRIRRKELTYLLPLLMANWLLRQPLPRGKAFAACMLKDCLSRPDDWERALVG